MRRLRTALLGGLTAALLVAGLTATATGAAAVDDPQIHTGVINGAEYKAVVPDDWNGTLVLYSHGYYPPEFPVPPDFLQLANRTETEGWLLDQGYALAASKYRENGKGYLVKEAIEDQLALLDWFEDAVGEPSRTVSYGQSLGAAIATLLAERHPDRFDALATVCGAPDPVGMYNSSLDMTFAVKTLLTDGKDADGNEIDLVRPKHPMQSRDALTAGVAGAVDSPQGRARIALAASLHNVAGWWDAHEPRPSTDEQWIRRQAQWLMGAYIFGHGPTGRAGMEAKAGGNPSWNVGVDYRRQLAHSRDHAMVRKAYADAGLDLNADLAKLAAARRIAPDPKAVGYLYRYGVPRGTAPMPQVSIHTTGDGGAVTDQERWYAGQVRRHGGAADLRQLYVERGAHCSNSAAEEIVMLRTLFTKMSTGRWPDLSPDRLNSAANRIGPDYQNVLDLVTGKDSPEPPSFTRFLPPKPQRPGR
jgi:pimeloyl-ACP methyl ester carboxylesterase